MGTGYVAHRAGLDQAARDQILESLTGLRYVIHHSATQIVFTNWTGPAGLLPAGRAFGPEIEARWWPAGATWEVQLLSETRQAVAGAGWSLREMETGDAADAQPIRLWGRHWSALAGEQGGAPLEGWVQAEIPADLSYPLAGSRARPQAQVRALTYRQDGLPRLTRFLDLETIGDD